MGGYLQGTNRSYVMAARDNSTAQPRYSELTVGWEE